MPKDAASFGVRLERTLDEVYHNDVVTRCYVIDKGESILSKYIRSRIHNNLIAGRFGLVGLRQLCTKLMPSSYHARCWVL